MKPLLIVCLLLAGVAVIFAVIATAIDYWMHSKVVGAGQCSVTVNTGLWELCVTYSKGCYQSKHECHKLTEENSINKDMYDGSRASRGLMITALLLMALSIPVLFVKGTARKIAPLCIIVGGLLSLIACIVYGAKVYGKLPTVIKKDTSLHAGFGLAIVSTIFAWIAAAVMLIGTRESGYYEF